MPSPTHLFKACEQGDFSTLITHLQSLSPSEVSSIRDEHQATLVHYACRYGYLPILQYLVEEKHLDLRQLRTEHGATGAHDAAVCDQLPILRYIFRSSKQLQWTVRDELGNTPLHLAASYNSVNVVHYLLYEESADPHHPSYNGLLALHYASEHGHHDCIKLLLDKAPDTINQQTSQLCTALHLACQNGLIDTMHLLISRGANFKVKDQNGANCLHIACGHSQLDAVQYLVEKHQANINEIDYHSSTPLHYAATSGNEHIVNYLLDRQPIVSADYHGNAPLHLAAAHGHHGVCAILLERNCCSLTSVNHRQCTAADLAEQAGYASLACELRLRKNSSLLQKATIVRLVIKKRNVARMDAACQVDEDDLSTDAALKNGEVSTSTSQLDDGDFVPQSTVVAIPKFYSQM